MKREIPEDKLETAGSAAIAFGFFDGLHLGHKALLDTLLDVSRVHGHQSMVHTFINHPQTVLGGGHPPMLFTAEEKWQALYAFGVGHVHMVPFTRGLSLTPYDAFIKNLMKTIPIREVVVGFNYRLGRRGEGTPEKLAKLGEKLGFAVHVVQPVIYNGAPISSTRIRERIQAGDLDAARAMLGRPFSVSGRVGEGYRLGARLGFPTANLAYQPDKVIVPGGVYATQTVLDGKAYASVTNVGCRPTVSEQGNINIETHMLGFSGDIYGHALEVRFWGKIRDEAAFDSIEALGRQIALDIVRAKEMFDALGVDYRRIPVLE